MSTDIQTAERLTRIESSIERIAVVLEKTVEGLSRRTLELEKEVAELELRIRALETELSKSAGVVGLLRWLGAPSLAAIVVFLATKR